VTIGCIRVGARQGLGDREWGELDAKVDSVEPDAEVGEVIELLGFDVVGGGLTGLGGSCKEDGNNVEGVQKSSMEAKECEEKGNVDSWNTTSREMYMRAVGI
jgi:hypothetical protein